MYTDMAKKLQLKAGQAVLVLNAPVGYVESLRSQHDGDIADHAAGEYDVAQLFVMNSAELRQHGPIATGSLKPDGILWLSYPKKSSGVKTDLARDDGGWASVGETGWQAVRQISVDDIWSSVRFRKVAQAEVRGDVDEQYSGPKASLRPIFDKVEGIIQGFGPDVAQYTRRNYVAFSRRNHFAAISPTTRSTVGIAFKMKGQPYAGRIEPNKGVGGGSFSHLVTVQSPEEVDDEVVALLRAAYNAEG